MSPGLHHVDVIVVGGGPAGCIVANTIAQRTDKSVLLLEAGVDRDPNALVVDDPTISPDLFVAQSSPAHVTTQRITNHRNPSPYLRGQGIGGSATINGLLCLPGLPSDYDAWAKAGCDGYSWDDLSPVFTQLGRSMRTTTAATWGAVDRMLVGATGLLDIGAWQEIGTARCVMAIDETGRRVVNTPTLRENLSVRTHTTVQSLLVDDKRVVHGVRLDDGTEIESVHTFLCTGAFASPAILLRSGIQRPGIGRNLHDHVGITLDLTIDNPTPLTHATMPFGTAVSNVVHHAEDWVQVNASSEKDHVTAHEVRRIPSSSLTIQVLPLNRLGLTDGLQHRGALMATPLEATHTQGDVTIDADGTPTITMPNDRDERDSEALRRAAVALANIGSQFDADVRPAIPNICTELSAMNDHELDDWIDEHPGSYFHAAGTCRMGAATDEQAVVDPHCAVIGYSGLSVVDASIIPRLPTAGPYLPVMAIATLAAERFVNCLST
jgi:choline dehydrogenase-like flavoprotein